MDREDWKRLKGLRRLIHDGVERGADFVERHHRHTAKTPFRMLESIKPIAAPTWVVRSIHDGVLSLTYGSIRAINKAAGMTSGWVMETLAPADEVDGDSLNRNHEGTKAQSISPRKIP